MHLPINYAKMSYRIFLHKKFPISDEELELIPEFYDIIKRN